MTFNLSDPPSCKILDESLCISKKLCCNKSKCKRIICRDHSQIIEEECVNEEEESLIQSFVNEEVDEHPPVCYSSRVDPYTTVKYTNLDEELKLVEEQKCFVSVGQLIKLVGTTCRKAG